MQLTDLPTPSLILDRRRLAQNVSRMRARADQFGVTLRPHLKTAKSARVAALATGGARGQTFRVLIEIDTGLGRAGVAPDAPEISEIARALATGGAELVGVLAHAGHSYHCHGVDEVKRVAEEERLGALEAALRLRDAGFPAPVVSVGSTPTAVHAERLDGVTEIRPGNFVFFDLFQVGVASCGMEDIAVSVLTSVIGHHRGRNHLLIDAGGLALSKDTGSNA